LCGDGEALFVRQFRYALASHTIEFPAGKIDQGESPLTCAARELREETGYKAGRWDFMLSVHSSAGFCDERLDIFAARDLSPVAKAAKPADEFVAAVKLPLKRALAMIDDGDITDAKTIAALWWLGRNLKKI
jgi:ADP-ribose pyrophosphatase